MKLLNKSVLTKTFSLTVFTFCIVCSALTHASTITSVPAPFPAHNLIDINFSFYESELPSQAFQHFEVPAVAQTDLPTFLNMAGGGTVFARNQINKAPAELIIKDNITKKSICNINITENHKAYAIPRDCVNYF